MDSVGLLQGEGTGSEPRKAQSRLGASNPAQVSSLTAEAGLPQSTALQAPRGPLEALVESVGQRWSNSRLSAVVPGRFLKFALVGGVGIVVNLVSLTLVVELLGWRDWRASATATFIAIVNNYALNNLWTFRDRRRTGARFVRGYVLYLLVSLVGLALTTCAYTFLTSSARHLLHLRPSLNLPLITLLFAQFASVLFGTYSNYVLNKRITWRSATVSGW